jgi:hypothetical protein
MPQIEETQVQGFVAFPSQPPSLGETIETAIKEINKSGRIDLTSWQQMNISGVPIISEIFNQIDKRSLMIADITNHNPNVLFELGYAIAKKKRIWLLHDSSTDSARDRFVQVNLLQPIGHVGYTNSRQIIDNYYKECPENNLGNTPYSILVEPVLSQSYYSGDIFYLKSFTPTESSSRLSNLIKRSKLKTIIDDPSENSAEPLSWYIRHVCGTSGLLVHLDADNISKAFPTNAKHALIAGFAKGLGKNVLILAHHPYASPIDYQLLLRKHDTAAKCVEYAEDWINEHKQKLTLEDQVAKKYRALLGDREFLASLNLGEHVAENEAEILPEYFVETGPYHDALRATTCLFIGRKGTGKTANLYKIDRELSLDKRNHVCIIKPSVYNTEAVLSSLRSIKDKAEMGGVYASLWKYLIYSELCLSFCDAFKSRVSLYLSKEEEDFIKFCEAKIVPDGDFSLRLEIRSHFIEDEVLSKWNRQNGSLKLVRLAEHLHTGIIPDMRNELIKLLKTRKRIIILIDNLDKAWRPREDVREMSDLLLGLLTIMGTIHNELGRDIDKQGHQSSSIQLSLIAFLRSDIYSHLTKHAREPDKFQTSRINWDDPDLLLRVISERIIFSNDSLTEEHVWSRIFPSKIEDLLLKEFIKKNIFPRPRDAIVLAKNALSFAISRGHEKIEESDLTDALTKYSDYALDSINVENADELGTIEAGTFALIGCKNILGEHEIRQALSRDKIDEALHDTYIKNMCRLTVLGVEITKDVFKFIYDDTSFLRDMKLAEVYSFSTGSRNYKIHPALCPALGVTTSCG